MKREITVNLVRNADSESYEVVSDYDLMVMRDRVTPEKALFDEKRKMHGRFYIRKG